MASAEPIEGEIQQNESKPAAITAAEEENAQETTQESADEELYCICRRPYDSRFMICCDACEEWFHGQCVGIDEMEASQILKYHCPSCAERLGPSTYKAERKSSRTKGYVDYSYKNDIATHGWAKISDILAKRAFLADRFMRISGSDLTLDYIANTGFKEPIIVDEPEGLGMTMPDPSITVNDIAKEIGDRPVEVMEVKRQESRQGWTLFQWAHYFSHPKDRKELLNVISLEISDSPFGKSIRRPEIVSQLDWIERFWPKPINPSDFPKVQLYCLMSPVGCWTDFHIDFGGSSVFYTLLSGEKTFYMIPPTAKNLQLYEKWSKSAEQNEVFFADLVKACYRIHLVAGNTMLIPSGWIHAVYTPKDSIVIGGNFLHGYAAQMQLQVYDIEKRSEVQAIYRFPYFERLCWYAARGYTDLVNDGYQFSEAELSGVEYLCDYLYRQILRATAVAPRDHSMPVNLISAAERKFIRDSIPEDLRKGMLCKHLLKELASLIADQKLSNIRVQDIVELHGNTESDSMSHSKTSENLQEESAGNEKSAPKTKKQKLKASHEKVAGDNQFAPQSIKQC